MSRAIRPFAIETSDEQLEDLRLRLRRTRWVEHETVNDWSQGVPSAYLTELCQYWAEAYDWRKTEARINSIPQYCTEIDGLDFHYLHVRSSYPNALPLIITHGWPGSIVEFLKVIGPLADPVAFGGNASDSFDIVCPSLPGYGYSQKPGEAGWGVERIGRAWAELMSRLGYLRYGAQGGDWGSMVTSSIGQQDPEHVAGIHLNMPVVAPVNRDTSEHTQEERAARAAATHYRRWDSGYSKQQSTRPQTLGYGLADSPVGQCAWIIEKFREWTDCGGHPENVLTRDELLDNIMLYWLPATGASSARLYWESYRHPNLDPVNVPTGCSIFPKEIMRTSRSRAGSRFSDLRYWNELDRGGHFAAFEQPELFVQELRSFFRLVR
jgi:pimeloyl-ACP methyl ester carboxylesterase